MRSACGIVAACSLLGALVVADFAHAQDATPIHTQTEPRIVGLWLTTDYPVLTEPMGKDVKLALSLENKNLPPMRVALSVDGLPEGWQWKFTGDNKPVGAAMVDSDSDVKLALELTPPKDAEAKSYGFMVIGKSEGRVLELPVSLSLTAAQPASVTLEPKLPALRGTPKSTFDYQVSVKNDGAEEQLFNLLAQAPPGFQVVFKEQYGSQELTSLPLKAGESKDLKVSVTPAKDAAASQYPVMVQVVSPASSAETQLVLDITGQPNLALAGPDGRLSGEATAGKEKTFTFTLSNTGTAPAQGVKMASSAPNGWKVAFDPAVIDVIGPDQKVDVAATMTPSDKAIAGDYVVTVRANGDGVSDNAAFRLTVLTSTLWGVAGLGVIGAAVIVLAFAVTRYGRR